MLIHSTGGLRLRDLSGKLLEQKRLNTGINTLNIGHYARGTYFIKTAGDEVVKIIKD